MSDKMWDVTFKHARECTLGNKLYIHRGPNFLLTLNPICEVKEAVINGQMFSSGEALNQVYIFPFYSEFEVILKKKKKLCFYFVNGNIWLQLYIKTLARQAYSKWDLLEVMERKTNEVPLLTQGNLD